MESHRQTQSNVSSCSLPRCVCMYVLKPPSALCTTFLRSLCPHTKHLSSMSGTVLASPLYALGSQSPSLPTSSSYVYDALAFVAALAARDFLSSCILIVRFVSREDDGVAVVILALAFALGLLLVLIVCCLKFGAGRFA